MKRWTLMALCLCAASVDAQQRSEHFNPFRYAFHRIGIKDGLPSQNISSVAQDRVGFMWFGTNNGLARYDGRNFQVFGSDKPEGIPSQTVTSLASSRHKDVWIGFEKGGVSRYDPSSATFHNYDFDIQGFPIESAGVASIYIDEFDHVWIVTDQGHLGFIENDHIRILDWTGLQGKAYVTSVTSGFNGCLWVGTSDGEVLSFTISTGKLKSGITVPGEINTLETHPGLEELWVGTNQSGAHVINLTTQRVDHFQSDNTSGSLPTPTIYDILIDSTKRVWLATRDGLSLFQRESHQFLNFQADTSSPFTLAGFISTNLYESQDGYIWIAAGGGVSRWDPIRAQFNWQPQPSSSFCEESPNVWWVGSWSGLYRYDNKSMTKTHYPLDTLGTHHANNAHILSCVFYKGNLWFAFSEVGLVKLDPVSGKFQIVRTPPSMEGDPLETIYKILPRGNEWLLATFGNGLYVFDPIQNTLSEFPLDSGPALPRVISDIAPNIVNPNLIWLGSLSDGVFLLDIDQRKSSNWSTKSGPRKSLSHNSITAIRQGSSHEVWIGTDGGGLNLLDPLTGDVSHVAFSKLNANVVNTLELDGRGYVWLCITGSGITRFDPRSTALVSFGLDDGGLDECASFSSLRGTNNTLFFGGINGGIRFNPNYISSDAASPQTHITSLTVVNKPITGGAPLWSRQSYEQNYREPVLNFGFSSISYGNPQRNKFAHRLLGLHEEWIESSENSVTYSGLAAGLYTLEVKSANRHGVWGTSAARFKLRVDAPPWRSWWAYCLYALVGLAAALTIIKRQQALVLALQREAELKEAHLRAAQQETQLKEVELIATHHQAKLALAERELELTAAVQVGFFPKASAINDGHFKLASFFRPASQCSGDWWQYDLDPILGLRWVLVGDVTGHGSGAAMITAAAATALRISQADTRAPFESRLRLVHKGVADSGQGEYHLAMTALSLSEEPGVGTLWSAGGVPVLRCTVDGRISSVNVPGTPLGATDFSVGSKPLSIEKKERILMFSDGIVEAKNKNDRQFGMKSFASAFGKTKDMTLDQCIETLVNELDMFRGSVDQDDDWTLVLIEREG